MGGKEKLTVNSDGIQFLSSFGFQKLYIIQILYEILIFWYKTNSSTFQQTIPIYIFYLIFLDRSTFMWRY